MDAGDQRGNTAKQIGKLVGVGATTIKNIKRLKKTDPDKFEEVVKGKTTAKKALKQTKTNQKKPGAAKNRHPKTSGTTSFTLGDTIYLVCAKTDCMPPMVHFIAYTIEAIQADHFVATNGDIIPIQEALNQEAAEAQHSKIIKQLLAKLARARTQLQAALKKPRIEVRDKQEAQT